MACYFFDSSGLFKRYVKETGSVWVSGLTDPAAANDIYLALITGVEIVSALVRQVPPLTPSALAKAVADFTSDFQSQYQRVAITEALISRAMALAQEHRLRAYDAVQLTAAMEVEAVRKSLGLPSLVLVSADNALNAAAIAEGLTLDNPNNHP